MDALRNLTNNIPEWSSKLSTLIEEIDNRQSELAQCAEGEDADVSNSGGKPEKSLKHKGSTESLRPEDEDAARAPEPEDEDDELMQLRAHPLTSEAIAKNSVRAIRIAHAKARAQVRAAQEKSASIASVENDERKTSKFRSRRMIKVYYDSFVQTFFEELVKFVSASRNLIRKAKMTAKVAHIKRVAEMESQDDDSQHGGMLSAPPGAGPMNPRIPSFRYNAGASARMTATSRLGAYGIGLSKPTDAYDRLDKALEFVQSQSERGAHQFLRDGDCSDEIQNIAKRLVEARELASKELDRIMTEEPDLARDMTEMSKVRTHRPTLMRREFPAMGKAGLTHQASMQSLRAGGQPIAIMRGL